MVYAVPLQSERGYQIHSPKEFTAHHLYGAPLWCLLQARLRGKKVELILNCLYANSNSISAASQTLQQEREQFEVEKARALLDRERRQFALEQEEAEVSLRTREAQLRAEKERLGIA